MTYLVHFAQVAAYTAAAILLGVMGALAILLRHEHTISKGRDR